MVSSLTDHIPDGARVLIDTNPLIYIFEGNHLARPFEPIFAAIDEGRIHAVITPITLAEIVAGPLKAGKEALAERYRQTLTANPGWKLCDINADIAMLAARLRSKHRLKLPDALQAATALHQNCHALITHDRDFKSLIDLLVLGVSSQ